MLVTSGPYYQFVLLAMFTFRSLKSFRSFNGIKLCVFLFFARNQGVYKVLIAIQTFILNCFVLKPIAITILEPVVII